MGNTTGVVMIGPGVAINYTVVSLSKYAFIFISVYTVDMRRLREKGAREGVQRRNVMYCFLIALPLFFLICLFIYLFIYLFVCLFVCLFCLLCLLCFLFFPGTVWMR